jgi:hypothetical protein
MFPQGLYNINHMPIPGMWMDEVYDIFNSRATWQLKFVWWPQSCSLSAERLWLCWAYKGTAVYTGPGEPVFEYQYHSTTEHIIWQLKRG